MGRRVTACGKAVATTTSDHMAKATLPDMRLMGQVIVPRKNWIDSVHLAANKTTNTKFDGGWVWKQNTKCGEPPPSKAAPDDHLPGAANGMFVDGCAEAIEGQGAPTVYVEGLKAICKDHLTYQNHKNTLGIIVNAEELAAYLAEPVPPTGDDAAADRVATDKLSTGGGAAGDDEDAREKDDEGKNVTTTNDATPACTLEKFEILDGKRKNSEKYVLEVIHASPLKLVATGGFCGDHAKITYGGRQAVGTTLEATASAEGVAQIAMLHKWWKEVRVTCDAHGKQITGTVVVCSEMKWELEVGEPSAMSGSIGREQGRNRVARKTMNLREKIKPYFKVLESKLPAKLPWADFKYLEGTFVVGASWKEQSNWQAFCEYSAGGKMMIVDASIKKEFFFFDWVRTLGPVGLAVYGVKEILEWIFDADLSFLKLEVKIGGKLECEATGTMGVDRFCKVQAGRIEFKGAVELYLSLTLKLAFTSAIDGSAGGKGTIGLELTGTIKVYPAGAVGLALAFKGFSLGFNLGLKVKLGWMGRLIPDWVSVKVKALLGAEIKYDKKEKTWVLSASKDWKLVNGWGKFDIFDTEFALP